MSIKAAKSWLRYMKLTWLHFRDEKTEAQSSYDLNKVIQGGWKEHLHLIFGLVFFLLPCATSGGFCIFLTRKSVGTFSGPVSPGAGWLHVTKSWSWAQQQLGTSVP